MAINNVNNNGNAQQASVDSSRNSSQQAQNQSASQTATRQASQAVQAPRQDSVSLTQSAQQLNQVQRRGSEAPVNRERVEELRQAIANGEYRVNPEVLASKIARLEAQVFGIE